MGQWGNVWVSTGISEFHLKLFLERVVIWRKSNSWDARIFKSIVWNVKSTRDYLKANNAEL